MLRNNKFINEKQYDNISSFNFTKNAFQDRVWNSQTILARGLFINTHTNEIVARSYNKFFNVNEREQTKIHNILKSFKYPVTAYVKENGFLGMVGYDSESDSLVYASKSTCRGEYPDMVRKAFVRTVSENTLDRIKCFLRDMGLTLVFEVVEPGRDPHIIEYPEPTIVLLDAVYRTLEYRKLEYPLLVELAAEYGLPVKEMTHCLKSREELSDWYYKVTAPDYSLEGENIEGFVLEDAEGSMVKIKLEYYTFWKHMRAVFESFKKYGNYLYTSSLTTPRGNYFYGFIKNKSREELQDTDIIKLRKEFEQSKYDIK